jgi:WXG100 family type VII secretion target
MSFQVTPEDLTQASANCNNAAENIQTQLGILKNYVNEMESWWQGIASGTFQQLMAEYDLCANSLHTALTGIANGLQGNWGNYTQNEQANIGTISNIQAGLPNPNLT